MEVSNLDLQLIITLLINQKNLSKLLLLWTQCVICYLLHIYNARILLNLESCRLFSRCVSLSSLLKPSSFFIVHWTSSNYSYLFGKSIHKNLAAVYFVFFLICLPFYKDFKFYTYIVYTRNCDYKSNVYPTLSNLHSVHIVSIRHIVRIVLKRIETLS